MLRLQRQRPADINPRDSRASEDGSGTAVRDTDPEVVVVDTGRPFTSSICMLLKVRGLVPLRCAEVKVIVASVKVPGWSAVKAAGLSKETSAISTRPDPTVVLWMALTGPPSSVPNEIIGADKSEAVKLMVRS